MIFGIGVDIVEIRRIKEAIGKHVNFIDRVFSKNEIEYLKNRNLRPEFVAGRFAAKEAVVKAMGTGFRGFDLKEVEIDRAASGKPSVILRGKAKLMANKCGNYKIHLSISHGVDNAIAYAIMEVDEIEDSIHRDM
ncbi:holo-ACP synthase [Clostridium sp. Mt-5]|uniref:Holo-[acyl-carrier-protein] synthase n=1 Tax=Clostridium moutaii TaxID=3240932 RepID=A0ABV4BK71_9CLOT